MSHYSRFAKEALHYVIIIILMLTFFSTLPPQTQDDILDMFRIAYSEFIINPVKGSN